MPGTTTIEWTDATWNPVTGCTKVSQGCENCYAERITERFHGKGSFTQITLHPTRLQQPLHWRKPRRVFVNSMSDLFHNRVPTEFIAQVFAVMQATPRHTYQVLTKRPGRARSLLDSWYSEQLAPANVWLGVSVETQHWAGVRIPVLQDTLAALRFLSCEPLLAPLDLDLDGIDWVITGGESGPGARPCNPDWVRQIRNTCTTTGTAFFHKQWGGRTPKANGRHLDGRTWDQMPDPTAAAANSLEVIT